MISNRKCVMNLRNPKFGHKRPRELLIEAIGKHHLPFYFVEYQGIRNGCKQLEPNANHICRNTSNEDIESYMQVILIGFMASLLNVKVEYV